jgi:hypothetical protein
MRHIRTPVARHSPLKHVPTATLELLARQQERMLAELASLRDEVNVLTAIVRRLHDTHTPAAGRDPRDP